MLKVCPQLPEKIVCLTFLKDFLSIGREPEDPGTCTPQQPPQAHVMVVTVSASCLCLLEHVTVISSVLLTLSPALSHHVIKSWREEL